MASDPYKKYRNKDGSMIEASPFYYFKTYEDGIQREICTKTRNQESAKRIRNAYEDRATLGRWDLMPVSDNISVQDWYEEFFKVKSLKLTPASLDRYTRNINKFLSYCKEVKNMRQFTSQHINRFITSRAQELGEWALKNELTTIKSFFNECEKLHKLAAPTKGISVKEPSRKEPNIYSQDEIRKMLLVSKTRDRAMLLLDLLVGLRKGEMASRKWKHIDFEQGKVWVRVENDFRPKDNATRWIPLKSTLRAALLAWRKDSKKNKEDDYIFPGKHGQYTHFDIIMSKVLKRAGIKGHCKKFRDTFASYSVACGVPVQNVRDWLGHSDIRITDHYLNYVPKYIEEDIRELFRDKQ